MAQSLMITLPIQINDKFSNHQTKEGLQEISCKDRGRAMQVDPEKTLVSKELNCQNGNRWPRIKRTKN